MNKKRLLRVATILDKHAAARKKDFDLESYVTLKTEAKEMITNTTNLHAAKRILSDCGYTACAIGEACLDSALRAQGLRFFVDMVGQGWPTYDGAEGVEAVRAFFGLNRPEVEYLFMPSEYDNWHSRKAVSRRIREFIKHGGIPLNEQRAQEQLELWSDQE